MRDSVRLGRLFGIPIGLHWSIVLIIGLFTYTLAGTILPLFAPGYAGPAYLVAALAVAALLLASVVAHELGHAVVALRNGVGVRGITLFALGGVARLDHEPHSPGAAGRIALAGPAVSVAIGLASVVVGGVVALMGAPALIVAGFVWLGVANVAMAGFNLLPALPLDGGRALQALLWHRTGNRDRATVSAASIGRYLGWGLVFLGLWQFLNGTGTLWTALIGWFVISTARAEESAARFRLWASQSRTGPFLSPGTGPARHQP